MQNSLLSNHILDVDAPSTPLDITADVKNTNVQLNWSPSEDNVGVVAYNVYQDGSVVATTSETGHKLVDLSPLTLYSFGVSAVDAAGNESGISTLQVTTGEDETPDTTPPTAPGNLDGTAGAHSVLLFWEASTDDREVKGYVVSVDGFVYDTLAGNAVSVLVNNLDAETLYSFEVYAFDRAGNNSESF
jgi:chitodextrinase